MRLQNLRSQFLNEELDYLQLNDILSKSYLRPRDKISDLLKNQDLIRVKKGLYVLGKVESSRAYSKEVLANLIYGPSAISLEYALSFYGMIPERVEVVTSITCQKNKIFDTPVGRFTYQYIHSDKYRVGITQVMQDETHFFLIATPEKALADKIALTHLKDTIKNRAELREYLFDDLRMDEDILFGLRLDRLKIIAEAYKNKVIDLLVTLIEENRNE